MKRKQQGRPNQSSHKLRAIDSHRLSSARGGDGIAIQVVGPTPFEMSLQHNEAFIRL